MANLTLVSPLRGWCAPIDETPDAVFAQRLLGDGVAIDPTEDTLHAPCDGEVISVAAARHAVALRAANGAEILLHVGIDTVALGGEGSSAGAARRARPQRRAAAELRSRRARAAREESDHADRHHQRRALLDRRTRARVAAWKSATRCSSCAGVAASEGARDAPRRKERELRGARDTITASMRGPRR